jgi:hypothetical protein
MTESPQLDQLWGEPTLLPWDLAHWKCCLSWLHPYFMVWRSWAQDSETSCHDQDLVGGFLSLSRPMLGECFKLGDNHCVPISFVVRNTVIILPSDAMQPEILTMLCRMYCGHCRAVARYGQQKVRPWLRLWHSILLIECWWLRPTMNYISGTGVNQFHSQSVTPQIKGRKLGNLLFTELKHVMLMKYWVYVTKTDSLRISPLQTILPSKLKVFLRVLCNSFITKCSEIWQKNCVLFVSVIIK